MTFISAYPSSAAGGVLIVTSGTRPTTGLFTGLLIYETDTTKYLSYNGSTWVPTGNVVICTSSTRPATPFQGLECYETDTSRWITWNGTGWNGVGNIFVVTSASRPAGFAGQVIFETDTKRTYVHDGTSFRILGSNIYGKTTHTAGDVALAASTAWKAVDSAMNITLTAAVGDVIEATPQMQWLNQAVDGYIDIATVVAGSTVNYFLCTGAAGDAPGQYQGPASALAPIMGSCFRTLVSGDISSGTVTLQVMAKQSAATSKSIQGTSTSPAVFVARNLGPVV